MRNVCIKFPLFFFPLLKKKYLNYPFFYDRTVRAYTLAGNFCRYIFSPFPYIKRNKKKFPCVTDKPPAFFSHTSQCHFHRERYCSHVYLVGLKCLSFSFVNGEFFPLFDGIFQITTDDKISIPDNNDVPLLFAPGHSSSCREGTPLPLMRLQVSLGC